MKKLFSLQMFIIFVATSIMLFPYLVSAEVVELNMTVVNPSEFERRAVPVKTYLPKNIKPEDVVDKGNFSIEYDFEKSLYFVYQEFELNPKQTAILSVSIRNIWIIPDEDIHVLKDHANKLFSSLKESKFKKESKLLSEQIVTGLDKILETQSLSNLSIDERIANYDQALADVDALRKDIGSLEDMAIEAGTLGKGQLNELMGDNFSTYSNMSQNEYKDTLIIRMSVANPFEDEREVNFKYPLPVEIKPEYILDSSGLVPGYDNRKEIFYLSNNGIKFAPKEEKEFAIEVKDLWIIQDDKMERVRNRVDKLVELLTATDYKDIALVSKERINSILDTISTSQNDKEASIENHIGVYRTNVERFKDALKEMTKLERLLIQSGGSIAKAMVDNKAPKAQGKGFKTEGSLPKGERGVEVFQRIKLKDQAPNVATTWRVIWCILIFLCLISSLFFILWWRQSKIIQNQIYRNVQSDYTQSKANSF